MSSPSDAPPVLTDEFHDAMLFYVHPYWLSRYQPIEDEL